MKQTNISNIFPHAKHHFGSTHTYDGIDDDNQSQEPFDSKLQSLKTSSSLLKPKSTLKINASLPHKISVNTMKASSAKPSIGKKLAAEATLTVEMASTQSSTVNVTKKRVNGGQPMAIIDDEDSSDLSSRGQNLASLKAIEPSKINIQRND